MTGNPDIFLFRFSWFVTFLLNAMKLRAGQLKDAYFQKVGCSLFLFVSVEICLGITI